MNLIEITMSPRAWICLMFLLTFLWMIIVSILLGINRRRDRKRAKLNEKEHEDFKRMFDVTTKVLRRIEGKIESSETNLKKMTNLVQTKLAPLMEKNSVVKELRELLDVERERFTQERKLTTQLGMQLKQANDILKGMKESKRKEAEQSKTKS